MSQTLQPFTSPPLEPSQLPAAEVEALYVHIPFCFHKCHYCDFYSITRQTPERMEGFVDLMLAEARQWVTPAARPRIRPTTVFFGGGTPTLLPPPAMARLLAGLLSVFDLSQVDEWTVEANPATVTNEYCDVLRAGGVNRLSFGAQSFKPNELATLERHHDPDDVPKSVAIARAAGFDRLNLDLIYAIPGQDLASWSQSLEHAISLGTTHLSCYGLTFESNTPIAVKKRLGLMTPVEESIELEMMHFTRERLRRAGMPAYEVSNYAAAGQECRHNLHYWHGSNYIGLGPSAASHVAGWRWRNRPHLGEWESAVAGGGLPSIEVERLDPLRRAGELAMLMLRLETGVRFGQFAKVTGFDAITLYGAEVDRLAKLGFLEVTPDAIRLTGRGINVADAVAAEFVNCV